MSEKGDKTRRVVNDVLLVLSILVIAVLVFSLFYFFGLRSEGTRITVIINKTEYISYPLSSDISVSLGKEAGIDGENILVIKEGKAYIASADCPDKVCAHHRPVSKAGETIVCLPHRLVIEVN